jgi:hypothetical protein
MTRQGCVATSESHLCRALYTRTHITTHFRLLRMKCDVPIVCIHLYPFNGGKFFRKWGSKVGFFKSSNKHDIAFKT